MSRLVTGDTPEHRKQKTLELRLEYVEGTQDKTLWSWLNQALRNTSSKRLQAEYPLIFQPRAQAFSIIAYQQDTPIAHCLVHQRQLKNDQAVTPIAMISLVYTDPHFRGHGFAQNCIRRAIGILRSRKVSQIFLWSDLAAFYRKLDFYEVGHEWRYWIKQNDLATTPEEIDQYRVRPMQKDDCAPLTQLYRSQALRLEREPEQFELFRHIPDSTILVAESEKLIRGYAALGRGDDFQHTVHEWGGEPHAVLACIFALLRERDALLLITGPEKNGLTSCLRQAHVTPRRTSFALTHITDPTELFRIRFKAHVDFGLWELRETDDIFFLITPEGEFPLTRSELHAFLYFSTLPAKVISKLSAKTRSALRKHGEWKLFLPGFDSI